MKLDKDSPIVVTSQKNSPMYASECEDCGYNIVASIRDQYCPLCGTLAPEEVYEEAKVEASSTKLKPCVICATCNSTLYSGDDADPVEMASKFYCTVCGSAEVDIKEGEDDDEDEGFEEKKEEEDEDKEDVEDDAEDEVQDKLENVQVEDLEATLLSSPEENWVLFHKGNPILRLKKSNQTVESSSLFTSPKFFDIFLQKAKETSIFTAAREFKADILDNKIMTSADVENSVYNRLQAHVLPKFLA